MLGQKQSSRNFKIGVLTSSCVLAQIWAFKYWLFVSFISMFQDFSSLTHTHKTLLHFNSPFLSLALLPLYIYLPIALYAIPCQIHTNQKRCHLPSIFQRHLPSSNIVVSSNPNPYELVTTKEGDFAFYIGCLRQLQFSY